MDHGILPANGTNQRISVGQVTHPEFKIETAQMLGIRRRPPESDDLMAAANQFPAKV
jgi:hypothetical protein